MQQGLGARGSLADRQAWICKVELCPEEIMPVENLENSAYRHHMNFFPFRHKDGEIP